MVFPPLPSSSADRSSRAFSQNDIATLEPHIPVERELGGGQTQAYRLTLKAGQYLYVVVEQKGIDVALALFGPDQAKVTEIVLPDILQGPKIIHAVTELAGDYRLEVRSKNKAGAAGRYEVQITTLREATAADLSIPARQLAEDDYEINLKGLIQTGEAERLGDYYFTVLKK